MLVFSMHTPGYGMRMCAVDESSDPAQDLKEAYIQYLKVQTRQDLSVVMDEAKKLPVGLLDAYVFLTNLGYSISCAKVGVTDDYNATATYTPINLSEIS